MKARCFLSYKQVLLKFIYDPKKNLRKPMGRHIAFGFIIIGVSITVLACAGGPARQTVDEWDILKTPLIEGEHILQANSCGTLKKASLMAGVKSKFGSCFLTNLRFIYEESKWFRTLDTAMKFVPSGGDFGIKTVLSGTAKALNANLIVNLGKEGHLQVVKREGRVIIPLSDIREMRTVTAFCLTRNCERWIEIETFSGETFVFEIYDFPPDKTGGVIPASVIISRAWKERIEKARLDAFGF